MTYHKWVFEKQLGHFSTHVNGLIFILLVLNRVPLNVSMLYKALQFLLAERVDDVEKVLLI